MAKINVETNRDSELVKYGSLQVGEAFFYEGEAYVRSVDKSWAVRLNDGGYSDFADEQLVTYVKRAELKLTI